MDGILLGICILGFIIWVIGIGCIFTMNEKYIYFVLSGVIITVSCTIVDLVNITVG